MTDNLRELLGHLGCCRQLELPLQELRLRPELQGQLAHLEHRHQSLAQREPLELQELDQQERHHPCQGQLELVRLRLVLDRLQDFDRP